MKLITKLFATSALVLAIAAPASAMVSPQLKQDVLAAAGSGSNINVIIDGSTVTLTGYVEDTHALSRIQQAAKGEGVDRVISNVFRSN